MPARPQRQPPLHVPRPSLPVLPTRLRKGCCDLEAIYYLANGRKRRIYRGRTLTALKSLQLPSCPFHSVAATCSSRAGSTNVPPAAMLLLDYQNVLIQSILTERFSGATPQSIDQVVSDFDGVQFHISTPSSKTQILISLSIKCFRELVQYGAEEVLQREYGNYITATEAGYDFSILVDLENLPSTPEEREELVRRISLLKRNVMAAPFEKAYEQFSQLSQEASKYTSESAPQGADEGGEVMAIHYREEEAIYIKASSDRVTVIFSTMFTDAVDRIFAKVFLQEFVDARRRAIQNAPQVLFRSDPPLELQGLKGVGKTGEKGEMGFITFGKAHALHFPLLFTLVSWPSKSSPVIFEHALN